MRSGSRPIGDAGSTSLSSHEQKRWQVERGQPLLLWRFCSCEERLVEPASPIGREPLRIVGAAGFVFVAARPCFRSPFTAG
jgi:hypothetical protein